MYFLIFFLIIYLNVKYCCRVHHEHMGEGSIFSVIILFFASVGMTGNFGEDQT